jgi:hypothetical protein
MVFFDADFNVTQNFALQGGFQVAPRVIQSGSTYYVSRFDFIIIVNKTVGSATTIQLPGLPLSQRLVIKDATGDAATHNITIVAFGTDLIDGASSVVLNNNYASIDLFYNGTGWSIL